MADEIGGLAADYGSGDGLFGGYAAGIGVFVALQDETHAGILDKAIEDQTLDTVVIGTLDAVERMVDEYYLMGGRR